MSHLPHDEIKPDKASEKNKKEQVTEMFDRVAGKYDLLNRILSARIDVVWRKKALKKLKPFQISQMLDIATGTGDLAIMAYKMLSPEKITGVDISSQMLEVGRKKILKEKLERHIVMKQGDAENLPFANFSFDAVTAAFGVRNFEDLEKGLSEIYRVLNSGGHLMILEFTKPRNAVFAMLYKVYMNLITPQVAQAVSNNKEAYQYLNKSAHAFPGYEDFTTILKKVGFKNAEYEALTGGICCIYTAVKP